MQKCEIAHMFRPFSVRVRHSCAEHCLRVIFTAAQAAVSSCCVKRSEEHTNALKLVCCSSGGGDDHQPAGIGLFQVIAVDLKDSKEGERDVLIACERLSGSRALHPGVCRDFVLYPLTRAGLREEPAGFILPKTVLGRGGNCAGTADAMFAMTTALLENLGPTPKLEVLVETWLGVLSVLAEAAEFSREAWAGENVLIHNLFARALADVGCGHLEIAFAASHVMRLLAGPLKTQRSAAFENALRTSTARPFGYRLLLLQ